VVGAVVTAVVVLVVIAVVCLVVVVVDVVVSVVFVPQDANNRVKASRQLKINQIHLRFIFPPHLVSAIML
jgi:peptidoglycan biosynthesis protein MviN/MurJ (putative lipid II flippase)